MKNVPFHFRNLLMMITIVGGLALPDDVMGQVVCTTCNGTGCTSGASAAGACAFAASEGSSASGDYSAAVSQGTASGERSFAASVSFAEGEGATAFSSSTATGDYSVAGTGGISLGEESTAFGYRMRTYGDASQGYGSSSYIYGYHSSALGHYLSTDASADFAMVLGTGIDVGNLFENDMVNTMMLGMNSDVPTIFIGNSGGTTGSYGNVGIGNITAPGSLLHVRDQVRVGKSASDNGSIVFNNTTNSNDVTIQSGVTSPSSYTLTLPVAAPATNGHALVGTTAGVLSWADPDANAWKLTGNAGTTAGSNFLGTTDAQDMVFKVNSNEVVRITQSDQYVGIGTFGAYTPTTKLHVVSDDADIARFGDPTSGNSNSLRITNTSSATSNEFSGGIQSRGTVTDKSALQLMALVDDGEDSGTVPTMNFRVRQADNDPIGIRPLFAWDNAGANTTVMLVDAAGNLGIGTTMPQGKLDVNGTVFVDFSSLPNGSQSTDYFLGVDASGQLLNLGMSTIQVKEQVEDIEFDTEAFLNLRPVDFKWKDFYGGHMDVGLIAQEVEQTFPALASYQFKRSYLPNGDFERDSLGNAIEDTTQMEVGGVRYHKLPVYLLALAKDQQTEIEDLRDQVESLMTVVQNCCAAEPTYRIDDLNGIEEGTKEIDEYVLHRNDPNPFADYTDIKYETSSCENCQIIITDMSGRIVKRINLFRSSGSIRVYASEIGNGVFSYSILEEGRVIASAKMISSRQ